MRNEQSLVTNPKINPYKTQQLSSELSSPPPANFIALPVLIHYFLLYLHSLAFFSFYSFASLS